MLDFLKFFQAEYSLNTKFGEVIFTPFKVGELVLTSGKLVASDPLPSPDSEPFPANFLPGSYPVILSIAHILENNNDRRVAFAMLCLSEQTPVRGEMATLAGEELSSLEEGEFFDYAVGSGTGCFVDADVAEIMDESIYAETE
jgi:hypothetical protein